MWQPGDAPGVPSVQYTYAPQQHNGNPANAAPAIMQTETVVSPTGGSTGYAGSWAFLDGLGRTIQTHTEDTNTASETVITSTSYDASGRVARQSVPYHQAVTPGGAHHTPTWSSVLSYTQNVYGVGGDMTVQQMASGSQLWDTSVEVDGYSTVSTDANGNDTTTLVDHRGRTTSVTDALSGVTSYVYNDNDQLTKVTAADGTVTTVNYADRSPWKTSLVDPNTGTWTYRYDTLGRLEAQKDDEAGWLWFANDILGRRTHTRDGGTGTNPVTTGFAHSVWAYEINTSSPQVGLLTSSRARLSTIPTPRDDVRIDHTYDQTSLELLGSTWDIDGAPQNYTMAYSYLDSGQVAAVTLPNNDVVTNSYGAVGQATGLSATGLAAGASTIVSSATYTPWGAPSFMQLGSGPQATTVQHGYDLGTLRLNSVEADTGATAVLDYSYVWDDAGNLLRLEDRGLTTGGVQFQCYGYDDLNRLTAAYTAPASSGLAGCGAHSATGLTPFNNTWTYNAVGNITNATGYGTPNGAYNYGSSQKHAVKSVPGATYTYNDVGSRTSRTAGGATTTLGYDQQHRLTSFTGGPDQTYRHDADGVRTATTEGGVTTWTIGEIYETSSSGAETISYRFGGLTVGSSSGTTTGVNLFSSFVSGHLSSVEAEVDSAGAVDRQTYTPFGMLRTAGSQNVLSTDWSFTNQHYDGTGLIDYRARRYDAWLGRFAQADSLAVDGFDRYAYVRNNPLNSFDPSGLCAADPAQRERCAGEGGSTGSSRVERDLSNVNNTANRASLDTWNSSPETPLNLGEIAALVDSEIFNVEDYGRNGYAFTIAIGATDSLHTDLPGRADPFADDLLGLAFRQALVFFVAGEEAAKRHEDYGVYRVGLDSIGIYQLGEDGPPLGSTLLSGHLPSYSSSESLAEQVLEAIRTPTEPVGLSDDELAGLVVDWNARRNDTQAWATAQAHWVSYQRYIYPEGAIAGQFGGGR